MEKAMTDRKGAGIFMAVMGGIGAAVGLWAFVALSFSLSKAGLSEVARQYMVAIGLIGEELAVKYGVKFFNQDFKKHDGFKQAAVLSR